MHIVARQISGLGNQLFQYAAGVFYSKRYSASLRLAIDPTRKAFSYTSPRPFLLSKFAINTPFRTLTAAERIFFSQNPLLQGPLQLAKRVGRIDVFKENFNNRYEFLSDLPIRDSVQTLYLFGYWQTYRIPEQISDELRTLLTFKEPPTSRNFELERQITASSNPISLHMRRGDYTHAAEGNIALPIDYYHRAIARLRDRLKDATFFVFSDDIQFAKENLPAGIKATFVDHNDDFSAHEDLRLMSACRHHIIANSTFSWWGAWLNPRKDKIVFAPKHWHLKKESYFPDLIPPEWNLLDSIRS